MPPLPKLIGSARASTAPARPTASSDLWESTWPCKRATTPKAFQEPRTSHTLVQQAWQQGATQPSCSERPSVQQLVQWIEEELKIIGLQQSPPSVERVRIFSTAFSEVIDMLPSYKPVLLAVQKEYDELIDRLQEQVNASAPMEGRLKMVKAEGLSLVGESMAWFQIEIASLRQRLAAAEGHRDALLRDTARLEQDASRLRETADRDRSLAAELHAQNLDILKHLERMERQVERLRATEKDLQGLNGQLKQKVREKDQRIQSAEDQLNTEREKTASMVPREEYDVLKADLGHAEATIKELEEINASKQKDYMSLVETYSKSIGQTLGEGYEARPLTPRPTWFPCRGLVDADAPHSTDKAEHAQELLQHMLTYSRTLLSAYGLAAASQKSAVFQRYSRHELTAPIASAEDAFHRTRKDGAEEGGETPAAAALGESSGAPRQGAAVMRAGMHQDAWLPPDTDPNLPEMLRHANRVKNLRFSRKKTADFIESLIHLRYRLGSSALSVPFVNFMLDHLPEDLKEEEEEETSEFAINVFGAVQRYASEPDFLAYLLLLRGRISDAVVRDNRALCAELLRIFTTKFGVTDGARTVTKQRFFYALREFMQNKEKDLWQDLVTYFPAGGPDVLVNYEWLLFDDPYILSPIVYALRLQHLEEAMAMGERLEKAVRGCVKEGQTSLRYDAVEVALKADSLFSDIMQAEDYAKAFGTPVRNLKSSSEQTVDKLVALLKQGDVFRLRLFPQLPAQLPDGGQPPAGDATH